MRKYFETQEQLKQKLLLSGVVLELCVAALPLHGVFCIVWYPVKTLCQMMHL